LAGKVLFVIEILAKQHRVSFFIGHPVGELEKKQGKIFGTKNYSLTRNLLL